MSIHDYSLLTVLELVRERDALTAELKDRGVDPHKPMKADTLPGIPDWDGVIYFGSDCIVNGIEIKAGTVLRVAAQPSPVWRWDPEKSEMVPFRYDEMQRAKR